MGNGRRDSDEHYVLDLCDDVLGTAGIRQHRFDWLRGDPSPTTGRQVALPVDAYWPALGLVVEFYEKQHSEAVAFFDKPDRLTVSGVHRGEQRALYDQRRRDLIPQHGLTLTVIVADEFTTRRGKILRDPERDRAVVARRLETFLG
ncbi:hypothetical protein [Antribacter gilvus]|uniref:hypothetical protein n=1 Tax=Antribacter gilvus TaxID=2304675 RepID=UPI000F767F17|nr:hypothetical protein [Antribacter gilvus]